MTQPTLTTYGGRLLDIGYAGEVVDQSPAVIGSFISDLALAIDFGVAVARSASDNTCKAPTVDGDRILGISVRHAIRPAVAGVVNYVQFDAVPIMRSGLIYAVAFENATRGDTVISVTAQNGKLGSLTGGAAGAGRVLVPGATWDTTVTATNIGVIRLAS